VPPTSNFKNIERQVKMYVAIASQVTDNVQIEIIKTIPGYTVFSSDTVD
jgi:hypothetical protein